MFERILVTSALPYANGPIHLGHLAGAYLPADFYTRYQKLKGRDVIYICGSDEHGVPVTLAAEKKGILPQDIVDKYHKENKQIFDDIGINFDYYGRTSSDVHRQTSQEIFLNLHEKGIFTKRTEEQLYDQQADMFLPDRYVKGTCPNCGYDEAYGDQCEKCGISLSPNELIDPVSVLTGNQPEKRKTEHWYLPLGKYQDFLQNWIDGKDNWKPNVTGQCKSWLDLGLKDRAVTRDLKWGVPVPLEHAENKVLYVWFDAPIGYISFTREWANQQGKPEKWKTYWQDETTKLVQFIGKDNIVFHCLMFPATLHAHGDYILPDNVPANEFLNLESKKLSTSRGWAVWLDEYLENYDADLLRYVLGTILPETKDSDFSWNDFQAKVNNELADILGNFIYRTLSFTEKYFDADVPELVKPDEEDLAALNKITKYRDAIEESYESYRFREAIAKTMDLARTGNRYFTNKEPWKTRKEDPGTCGNTLHVCLQISAALSFLFDPILPQKMNELRQSLHLSDSFTWDEIDGQIIKPGQSITKSTILFTKIEDETIEAEIMKLKEQKEEKDREAEDTSEDEAQPLQPLKDNIDFETFTQMDIRAGEILSAEKIEKSNKLLKITVDIGLEERTIVSGISNFYSPEELTGQKVAVVANLAPKKLMGVMSQGMILMAEEPNGDLTFVETSATPGSPIL